MPCVQTAALVTFSVDDSPFHRSAVCMHVEDRKKNTDPTSGSIQHFGFLNLDNVRDCSIRRCYNGIRVGRDSPFWVAEKRNRVNEEQQNQQEKPKRNEVTRDPEKDQPSKDPSCFEQSLKSHRWPAFSEG